MTSYCFPLGKSSTSMLESLIWSFGQSNSIKHVYQNRGQITHLALSHSSSYCGDMCICVCVCVISANCMCFYLCYTYVLQEILNKNPHIPHMCQQLSAQNEPAGFQCYHLANSRPYGSSWVISTLQALWGPSSVLYLPASFLVGPELLSSLQCHINPMHQPSTPWSASTTPSYLVESKLLKLIISQSDIYKQNHNLKDAKYNNMWMN